MNENNSKNRKNMKGLLIFLFIIFLCFIGFLIWFLLIRPKPDLNDDIIPDIIPDPQLLDNIQGYWNYHSGDELAPGRSIEIYIEDNIGYNSENIPIWDIETYTYLLRKNLIFTSKLNSGVFPDPLYRRYGQLDNNQITLYNDPQLTIYSQSFFTRNVE